MPNDDERVDGAEGGVGKERGIRKESQLAGETRTMTVDVVSHNNVLAFPGVGGRTDDPVILLRRDRRTR